MKLLQALHALLPRVEVRVIKHLTTDLRSSWQMGLRAHKQRRRRECRKVPPCAIPDADLSAFMRRQAD